MITLDTLDFLTSRNGADVLAALAEQELGDERTLALLTALRKTLPAHEAGAALELARLRRKATAKFGDAAARMWFTRDALEQASDPAARRYHAGGAAGLHVADMCCGIGTDALAFAAVNAQVLAVEQDPMRAAMARLNADALGLPLSVQTADARSCDPDVAMLFFDPARRDDQGRRIHAVKDYQPPLSSLRRWRAPRTVSKLSPGVDLAQLAGWGGEVEFLSVEGALKEALLRTGPAQWGGDPRLRATRIEAGEALHWPGMDREPGEISAPRGWLIEPDPALIRAGLVTSAGRAWGAAQLDDTIAYLTADAPPETPWARAWEVFDWLPFNVKALRAALRERDVGYAAVKKRGSPVTPEALLPQLKLKGSGGATIVLTRHAGKPIALICGHGPWEHGWASTDEFSARMDE
jgi:hypothetical protein